MLHPENASPAVDEELRHGPTGTLTRPAGAAELAAVNELHSRCSQGSLYKRYLGTRTGLTPGEWHHMTNGGTALTWVTYSPESPEHVIAVLQLVGSSGGDSADLGLLIEDPWQNRRLGTALLRHARTQGLRIGATAITGTVDRQNTAMLHLLKGLGASLSFGGGSVIDAVLALPTIDDRLVPAQRERHPGSVGMEPAGYLPRC
ncbi:GNAT family N-acetyltransferase [Streptomyces sp. NPDC010273]|uniref:GNAT family N-acetyltransferase n=1 Tax=Streptomyces sp. NPDC010273 TaxID=3364829 RepID=UPI0036E89951